MGWDWVIDTGKGLVAIFIVWLANMLRKQSKPILVWFKEIWKLAETVKELKASQAVEKNKLLAMVNISPNPYYIIDNEGRMIYANQAWIELTGFRDEKEAYGLGYLRAVHPDARAEVSRQREMLANTKSAYNGDVRLRNLRTQKDILKICVSQTFENEKGEVVGTIGTLIEPENAA